MYSMSYFTSQTQKNKPHFNSRNCVGFFDEVKPQSLDPLDPLNVAVGYNNLIVGMNELDVIY